ncbi:unnamed protein product [Adineta steineri]|uniref:F-box domain-containing protein n=1 Tax=Adineta steineri TaxID=433720 RepID=A0A819EGE2_9BILA|nr:unnamed protein product [Adineta steineri]
MITSLEDLSNEVFLEIFDYVKIHDLAYGFWNLNKRLNQLIRSLKNLSLIIKKENTYESIVFSQQIIRIVIVTLANIELNPFSNLRSLTLNMANENHLKQIRSDILPNLVYLSIPISFDFQLTKQLASEIFSNCFTSLRYTDLRIVNMPDFLSWSQCSSLRSIHLFSPNINIIPLILQTCTQLTYFGIRITNEHRLKIFSLPNISNHPLKEFIFIQPRNSTFIFDIESIFPLMPNLKRLDLQLYTTSFIDLIELISKSFRNLVCFNCYIMEYRNKDEIIDIYKIRNIHSSYFNIKYILREHDSCLYTTHQNLIRLENLPNELLIDIFKYLDIRRLYRSFYNLNDRINNLLESLNQLYLVIWSLKDDHYDDLFASRVHTLVVHFNVSYNLSRYNNVRHLVLFHSKHDQISQVMINGSHLETMSLISPRCFYTTFGFHEMIFSNKFPYLKSCHLTNVYSPSFQLRQLSWSQSPFLRSLHISSHDSLIHVAILNACPNLHSLHLSLFQLDHTPLDVKPHENLKKMKFILNNLIWPLDNTIFETFFCSMPYLERLIIQRSATIPEMLSDLLQFDWLSKVITQHLSYLKQFIFYLHFINSNKMDQSEFNKVICQIQTNFVNNFHNYRHYRLKISKI